MLRKGLLLTRVLATLLAGCSWPGSESAVFPDTEWTWASSPESLGWSSGKLAAARTYSERIGSAAPTSPIPGTTTTAFA